MEDRAPAASVATISGSRSRPALPGLWSAHSSPPLRFFAAWPTVSAICSPTIATAATCARLEWKKGRLSPFPPPCLSFFLLFSLPLKRKQAEGKMGLRRAAGLLALAVVARALPGAAPHSLHLRGGGLWSRRATMRPRFEPPPKYEPPAPAGADSAWADVRACLAAMTRLVVSVVRLIFRIVRYLCRFCLRLLASAATALVFSVAGAVGSRHRRGVEAAAAAESDHCDWFILAGERALSPAKMAVTMVAGSGDRQPERGERSGHTARGERMWGSREEGSNGVEPSPAHEHVRSRGDPQDLAASASPFRALDSTPDAGESRAKRPCALVLGKHREPFTPSKSFFKPSPFCAFESEAHSPRSSEGGQGTGRKLSISRLMSSPRAEPVRAEASFGFGTGAAASSRRRGANGEGWSGREDES